MITVSFFVNRLNQHQEPIAAELFSRLGECYRFVETTPPSIQSQKGSSDDYSDRPYLIQAWKDEKSRIAARSVAITSDVAVFGAESFEYEVLRLKSTNKVSFEMSERWLKRGLFSLFSPRLIRNQWFYHTLFYDKPLYKLCTSGFAAADQKRMLSFRGRCYKWGYFINSKGDLTGNILDKDKVRLLWCARFLKLKHPELAIKLVKRLLLRGYNVQLDMYGDGPQRDKMINLVKHLGLESNITIPGAIPNTQVIKEMKEHDIFLFTSNRYEGWGVVANEAMLNGCLLVASNAIGSTPFLIKHQETGIVFRSGCLHSLENEVAWLIDNPVAANTIRKNAHNYMERLWTPKNAVDSFLLLSDALFHHHKNIEVKEGPCSKA